MIDIVYFNPSRQDSEEILTRDEMKKIVGGLAAPSCKTTSCMVFYPGLENGDDGLWPGDCDGDGTHCYCNIGTDVGPVNSGGVSHCTVGH
jgi:hypothetical protein